MAQLKDTIVSGNLTVHGDAIVEGLVNIEDFTQFDSEVRRLNIFKVLDISAVNNEVRIKMPEGYTGYVSTEGAPGLKYCSWVNGYSTSWFSGYSSSLEVSATAYSVGKVNDSITYFSKTVPATTTVSMNAGTAHIPLASGTFMALQGGTDIIIKVTGTDIPADYIANNFNWPIPKILIWGTIFCFKRKVTV